MDASQIILIVFIVLLVIIYPILISSRNKKENERMKQQTNSLKKGDKVLTTSGIYGTIIDIHLEDDKNIVTIETGTGKNKGYISVDAYAIYNVFADEKTQEGTKILSKEEQNEKQLDSENSSETSKSEIVEEKEESANIKEDVLNENLEETAISNENIAEKKEIKKASRSKKN